MIAMSHFDKPIIIYTDSVEYNIFITIMCNTNCKCNISTHKYSIRQSCHCAAHAKPCYLLSYHLVKKKLTTKNSLCTQNISFHKLYLQYVVL